MRGGAFGRWAAAIAAAGGLTAATVSPIAPVASAAGHSGEHGQGAACQVEISANVNPTTTPGACQGNVWARAALYRYSSTATTGTTDYQETDCIHADAVGFPVGDAAHDTGDGGWHTTGTTLYLTTVHVLGGKRS